MSGPGRREEQSATSGLAGFVVRSSVSLPEEVLRRAKVHLLDTIGCMVAFASLPWSEDVRRYVASSQTAAEAPLVHFGTKVSVSQAAFANACFGHGFEMDDTEMRSASHPGVVVVPAALAAASAGRATGAELLRSIAVGYEVMVRVGLAGVSMMERGFHTTSVAGPFGAAAATAVLWDLPASMVTHGLGIAASHASGITEYSRSGGSVKRVHAGIASRSGVEAMALARAGITAPRRALEGPRGLLAAVANGASPRLVTSDLGQRFEMMTTGIKPYCCCAGQHTVLDAVGVIRRASPELDPRSIKAIRVWQRPREVAVVGRIVEPEDVTGAQFSAAFGIALNLLADGNEFIHYLSADLRDPDLLGLARRVEYLSMDDRTHIPGEAPAVVEIELEDGRILREAVGSARGSADRPMSADEVVAKFHGLADGPLGQGRAHAVVEQVLNLEQVGDVSRLTAALVARPDYIAPRAVFGS